MDQHQLSRSPAWYALGMEGGAQAVAASAEILAAATEAARLRAVRRLCDGLYGVAWAQTGWNQFRRVWFRRGRLAETDREDLCQEAVVTAFRAWTGYQPELGSISAWMYRIVYREARKWVRVRGTAKRGGVDFLGVDVVEVAKDMDSLQGPVEEGGDPVAHVLEPLSGRERLIVELHTVVGLSFEEIGALQGISKSEAQRIHQSGLERLDRARKNWCLPPLPISTDRPSPDALGRAWARVVAEGLADVPTAPPASGPRLSPSSRPSVALGSVAPYAGRGFLRLIICSFICGLSFCGDVVGKFGPHSRAASAAPVSAPSAPPARAQMSGASVASGEPEVTRRSPPPPVPVSSLPDAESPLASASARPPPTRHDLERDLLAERVLVDQARVLLRQNPRAAIAAVLEARDLFPHGRSAAAREETFKKACAKIGAHEPLPPACLRP